MAKIPQGPWYTNQVLRHHSGPLSVAFFLWQTYFFLKEHDEQVLMLQLNSLLSPNTYKLGLLGVCGPASLNKGNFTRGPIAGFIV